MVKTIKIGDKEIVLNNNGGWAMEYQAQFNKDILPVILPLVAAVVESISAILAENDGDITTKGLAEAVQGRTLEILAPIYQTEVVDLVYNVTWALNKNADPDVPEPRKWIRQFDTFPLDVVIPEVYGFVMSGFISSKNLERLEGALTNIKTNLQPLPLTK